MGSTPDLARGLLHEVRQQDGDVLAALPQRGGMDPDDVQAVEEVLPERAGAHPRFEDLVRGGDDPDIDPDRHVAPDAIELSVGQHPQQARLELGRHVSDLVEEQRAAIGLLEAAETPGLRTGEGTAFVTEELGFEELARDRGGIERDERLGRPRAVTMQGPRNQLLSGARLAGDEHREVRSGQPSDRTEHLLHRGRRPDDSRSGGDHRGSRIPGRVFPVASHCTLDQGDRLVGVERLRQVLERTAPIGGHGAVEVGIAGHDHHREMRIAGGDLSEQIQTIHAGHADVGDDRVPARVVAGAHVRPRRCRIPRP